MYAYTNKQCTLIRDDLIYLKLDKVYVKYTVLLFICKCLSVRKYV